MEKANEISKRPDQKVGVKKDNKNQTLIKEQQIHSLAEVVIEGPKVDILEKIKIARDKDKEIIRIVEETGVKVLHGDEWQIKRDLVLKKEKVYMLKNEELRVEIIQLQHDVLVAGHGERWKMSELVTRNYWWPGIMRDVGKYVDGYNIYQRMKNRIEVLAGKLKLSEILEKPWIYLIVDFITKLLLVAGKGEILVVCNRLLKMTYFVATMEETLVEGLARLFRDVIQKLHRSLESVMSDRDLQFAVELMRELNKMLRIETKLLTFFHLQTDRQSE